MNTIEEKTALHTIRLIRHETKRPILQVVKVEHITPRMVRVFFTSTDLAGFVSASPDDHIKLIFRQDSNDVVMRDFTPRRFDVSKGTLVIDFALHAHGPATDWVSHVRVGDSLEIGGPRGSAIVPEDFEWWLLIGDETAIPAIGRRLEELGKNCRVTVVIAIVDEQEKQVFTTAAELTQHWIYRPPEEADKAAPMLDLLKNLELPTGDGYIWIAAEASVARAVRADVVERLGHPLAWTKAAGYWKRGVADSHESLST